MAKKSPVSPNIKRYEARSWLSKNATVASYVQFNGIYWNGEDEPILDVSIHDGHNTADLGMGDLKELDNLIQALIAARLWLEGCVEAQKKAK